MLFSDPNAVNSTVPNIEQIKKTIESKKGLVKQYKGNQFVEVQNLNVSIKKIAELRGELDSLSDKIRRYPKISEVKVWKSTRMSKRLAWLQEKDRKQTLLMRIQQIQVSKSYEADELNSLLVSVNESQEVRISEFMHLISTQEDRQLTGPSVTKSGPALAGKIIQITSI
jgi:hypothetical protein